MVPPSHNDSFRSTEDLVEEFAKVATNVNLLSSLAHNALGKFQFIFFAKDKFLKFGIFFFFKILMYLIPGEHDIIVIYRRHFNKMLSIMDALWAKKNKLVGLVDPYNSYVRDPRVGTPFPQVIERI